MNEVSGIVLPEEGFGPRLPPYDRILQPAGGCLVIS